MHSQMISQIQNVHTVESVPYKDHSFSHQQHLRHFICNFISVWSFSQSCRTKRTLYGSWRWQRDVLSNTFFSAGAAIRTDISVFSFVKWFWVSEQKTKHKIRQIVIKNQNQQNAQDLKSKSQIKNYFKYWLEILWFQILPITGNHYNTQKVHWPKYLHTHSVMTVSLH